MGKSKIFISYSRKDTAVVDGFYHALKELGFDIWYDIHGIIPSEQWMMKIEKAIEDCDVFLYFSSKNSNCRPEEPGKKWYTRIEVTYALKRDKTIFPIIIDSTQFPDGTRIELEATQHIEYNVLGFEKSLELLKNAFTSLGIVSPTQEEIRKLKLLQSKYDSRLEAINEVIAEQQGKRKLLIEEMRRKGLVVPESGNEQDGSEELMRLKRECKSLKERCISLEKENADLKKQLAELSSGHGDSGPVITNVCPPSKTIMVNGCPIDMILVRGGSFQMGAYGSTLEDAQPNEKPDHWVNVQPFYMAKFQVTRELWAKVMGDLPMDVSMPDISSLVGNPYMYPVHHVSWEECMKFIKKLKDISGEAFMLPTEEQWEFAARGGNENCGHRFSGSNAIPSVGWYAGNSGGYPKMVGSLMPNELGIYDMSGNVWEWCANRYSRYETPKSSTLVSLFFDNLTLDYCSAARVGCSADLAS